MPRGIKKEQQVIEVQKTDAGLLVPTSGTFMNSITEKYEFPCVAKELGDKVEIWRKDGTFVREYSLDIHGEKFVMLAHQFVHKKNNVLI